MTHYNHRGHRISILIARYPDKLKVETEIYLPSADASTDDTAFGGDAASVSVLALEDIHKEALQSAMRTVDVLIAERVAVSKAP